MDTENRPLYTLEDNPEYTEEIEMLLDTDVVKAENSFFQRLLLRIMNNIKAVRNLLTAHNGNVEAHPAIHQKIQELAGDGIAAHNVATDSHQDIRTALTNKANVGDVYTKAEINQKLDDLLLALRPLNDLTWAQIARASESGKAASYWSVGDEKDITLTTGETLTLQIYGFNHDDLESDGKAGITFGLKNLMAETRRMEAADTNMNGFTGSELYGWLTGTLFPSLPSDLRSAIKPVIKKTSAGGNSTTILSKSMSAFLFSEVECFGTTTHSVIGEGTQYPVFNTSRIKKLSNGTGLAAWWWERSPRSPSASDFCYVGNNDIAGYSSASIPGGVCFGFCV